MTSTPSQKERGFASPVFRRYRPDSGSDALDDILSLIGAHPVLSEREMRATARRAFRGDVEAQQKLIFHNIGFAVDYAKRYRTNTYGVPLVELVLAAITGLGIAAAKYDPDHDTSARFISYAVWWMRNQIQKVLTTYAPVKMDRDLHVAVIKVKRAVSFLEQRGFHNPSAEDIAFMSDLPVAEVCEAQRAANFDVVALEDLVHYDRRTGTEQYAVDPAPAVHEVFDRRYKLDVLCRDIQEFLGFLDRNFSARRVQIFWLRYGLGRDFKIHSQTEVGREMDNISRQAVDQNLDAVWDRARKIGQVYTREWFEIRLRCAVYLSEEFELQPAEVLLPGGNLKSA